MKNKKPNVFWPIFLIVLGLLFIINNLNVVPVNIWNSIWQFWPILVIILAITNLLRKEFFGGMMLLTLGCLFQVSVLYGWELWGTLWPLFIVAAGIGALLENTFGSWFDDAQKSASTENRLDETCVFRGLEKRFSSKSFEGGKVEAIFGSAKINLSEVDLHKDGAKMKVDAVFGSSEIIVSKEYNVNVKSVGVFGGVEDKTENTVEGKPTLSIEANAIFGGVEIRY